MLEPPRGVPIVNDDKTESTTVSQRQRRLPATARCLRYYADRMTTWLTDDEQQVWRSFLYGVTRTMNNIDDALQARSDLAMTDYEILVVLSELPDHQLRMSELANRVLISRSRLTYRVNQLIRRGFVARVKCEDDGRGLFAVLTPAGLHALSEAAPGHVEDVREFFLEHLAEEDLESLTRLLGRLNGVANAV